MYEAISPAADTENKLSPRVQTALLHLEAHISYKPSERSFGGMKKTPPFAYIFMKKGAARRRLPGAQGKKATLIGY